MLTTLITIVAMFSVILVAHNYLLDAIHKDALSQPKSPTNITD